MAVKTFPTADEAREGARRGGCWWCGETDKKTHRMTGPPSMSWRDVWCCTRCLGTPYRPIHNTAPHLPHLRGNDPIVKLGREHRPFTEWLKVAKRDRDTDLVITTAADAVTVTDRNRGEVVLRYALPIPLRQESML